MIKLIHDLLSLVELVFTLAFMRDVACLFLFLEHKQKRFRSWTITYVMPLAYKTVKASGIGLYKLVKSICLRLQEKKKQKADRVKASQVNPEETKQSKLRDLPDYLKVVK